MEWPTSKEYPHADHGAGEHLSQVPQLKQETGVSTDYANTYMFLILELQAGADRARIAHILEEYRMPHYEERFPPDKFTDVVNNTNRERVREINCIADLINTDPRYRNPADLPLYELVELINTLNELLYGKPPYRYTFDRSTERLISDTS